MNYTDMVLFDLDGTLLDTEPDFTFILNQMLAAEKRRPVSASHVRRTVSSGGRALVSMAFGITEEHSEFEGLLERFLDKYEEQIQVSRCSVFPGVEELLNRLDDEGVHWSIVTNKISRFTLPLLGSIPALKDCPTVVCRDQVAAGKPAPDALLRACELSGINPQRPVYVGDHPRDMEAAHKARMGSVAVAWGFLPDGEPIEHWGADYIADDTHSLGNWLLRKV